MLQPIVVFKKMMVNIKWCKNGGLHSFLTTIGLTHQLRRRSSAWNSRSWKMLSRTWTRSGSRGAGTTKVELVGWIFGNPRSWRSRLRRHRNLLMLCCLAGHMDNISNHEKARYFAHTCMKHWSANERRLAVWSDWQKVMPFTKSLKPCDDPWLTNGHQTQMTLRFIDKSRHCPVQTCGLPMALTKELHWGFSWSSIGCNCRWPGSKLLLRVGVGVPAWKVAVSIHVLKGSLC